MLDSGQPGELPLMRELIALKRARSLRDPSTIKTPGFENAPAASNSNQKPLLRGHVGRSTETGKAGSGRVVHYHLGGQLLSNTYARRISRRNAIPVPKSSPTQGNDDGGHVGWDLGLQGTSFGSETQQQQDVFGGLERRNSPKSGGEFPHKLTGDANDDDYSLQNWTNSRRVRDGGPEYAQQREQRQNLDERATKLPNVPLMKAGVSSRDIGDSFEFRNQAGSKKSPTRKGSTLKRETTTKQSSQVLSPLMLNSHDDSLYAGGQQLTTFSLEGPSYEEQEHWKQDVNAGPYEVHGSASRPLSPFSREPNSRMRLASTADKTSWVPAQDFLTSSSHTSQRTLSQVSLPDAWEASLDDELDVSELPRNGCGMPCRWPKGKRQSKRVGNNPSDPSRRKGGASPKAVLKSQGERVAEHIADDLCKPILREEKGTAPLFAEPSALADNGGTSSSDGLRRKLGGVSRESGPGEQNSDQCFKNLTPGIQMENRRDCSTSDGKELAVFIERPRSLCQKYRPKTFDELIGQNLVTHALSNAVAKGKVAPVYLFQGSRGTGKTSAARIFAASLNCLTSGDRKPCGLCSQCIALASGNTPDVHEIDAASHNGIENVKALLQNTFAITSGSRYKVFIIDECHMLTHETWTTLLRLLEEPPRNVVVILITTDPGKLPRTAISRCQKFLFPKIKHADIVSRLQNLVKLENLDIEPGALDLIASKSEGSLRDAETVLDQLSLLGQRITLGTIHELVGSVSDDKLLSLLDLALSADTVSTVRRARELIDSGIEPLDLMSQLATLITDILAGSYEIMNRDQDRGFFSRHALSEGEMERLRTALKILSEAEKQLREASKDRTTWLTAALLRFGPDRPSKVAVSSTTASLTPSPVSRSARASKKLHESKGSSRWRRETRRKCAPKRTVPTNERRTHVSSRRRASRPIKPGYEIQVHPTDQSSPHDASREFSTTESSVAESPFSNEGSRRHSSFKSPGNLRSIWLNVLEACGSKPLRQLLQYHGKLLAMSFSAVDAVAHLEFAKPELKQKAERCRKSIANIFKKVLGLSVEVKISLASLPLGMSFTGPKMWSPATTRQFTSYARTESDEAQTDRNDPEAGSLRHWTLQSGVSFNQKTNPSSPYCFPAIPTLSSGLVMEPRPMSRRQNRVAGSRFEPNALVHEGHRLETAWLEEGRNYSPLQFFENPQQRPTVPKDYRGDSQHHDQPSGSSNYPRNDLNKAADGLHAQKYAHGLPNYRDSAASDSLSIEEENLRLESRMKYGGLLCWKAPRAEQEKAMKQHRRRKRGILIRLVPCVRSRSP
ncbi:hypothetical protein GOP47_0014718 [Adiantum capillus-veneris]|uniref:DNA-directed DNA polymerase n=1 Tax=Adiantum capillus-veneris TaxID=13818 RepID=A0A9D4ZEG9_ADICA|nr:hypothetical protein GOP47_0014718 [Adiantum capillus-veneris]